MQRDNYLHVLRGLQVEAFVMRRASQSSPVSSASSRKATSALVGNKGYRRFPATPSDEHFTIDPARVVEDEPRTRCWAARALLTKGGVTYLEQTMGIFGPP